MSDDRSNLTAGVADPFERARQLYEQAVFGGVDEALATADRVLDGAEATLSLARGRIVHSRFLADRREDAAELALFERAATLYHELGDVRGEAESLFWVGTFYQVVRSDSAAALPALKRAQELAIAADDKFALSYVVRHLGFAEMEAGQPEAARELFEQSVRLRREVDFQPGVAAGVLALAELAAEQGDRDRALALLDEASSIATESGANGILGWIAEARKEI